VVRRWRGPIRKSTSNLGQRAGRSLVGCLASTQAAAMRRGGAAVWRSVPAACVMESIRLRELSSPAVLRGGPTLRCCGPRHRHRGKRDRVTISRKADGQWDRSVTTTSERTGQTLAAARASGAAQSPSPLSCRGRPRHRGHRRTCRAAGQELATRAGRQHDSRLAPFDGRRAVVDKVPDRWSSALPAPGSTPPTSPAPALPGRRRQHPPRC